MFWVFNCKEVTEKISLSLDKKLSFSQTMGIKFHLMMCKLCARYHNQVFIIHELTKLQSEMENHGNQNITLSTDMKNAINIKITDHLEANSNLI